MHSIEEFRSRISGDPRMEDEFLTTLDFGPQAVIALGKRYGYEFDLGELARSFVPSEQITLSAFEQKVKDRLDRDSELSDFELELVSAGAGDGIVTSPSNV